MSVICDLQFNVVGVGSVFARLPVRSDVDSLPQQVVGSVAIGNRYVRMSDHTPIAQTLNQDLAINCPTSAIICLVLQNKHKLL
jgi:hypothetical protein